MFVVENYLAKNNFIPHIQESPDDNLGLVIVIPCYNEPDLLSTLVSLKNCTLPPCATEIIIVINHAENTSPEVIGQNDRTFAEAQQWIQQNNSPQLTFRLIYEPSLPQKHAGVGLARKIGMDEALYRFHLSKNYTGIMVGFDADSLCDTNYLEEIWGHFQKYTKTPGASIYFEHPLNGSNFPELINEGIALYELHLRYLNQGIKYTGHPHAFHTVGSSFAVRAESYAKQGGMNKRKAGEDFYFIQKIVSLGNYSEINTTRVIPSPRESDRVPFGTGAAIRKWIATENPNYLTYNWNAFESLQKLFLLIEKFYSANPLQYNSLIDTLHPSIISFLLENDYINELQQIKNNTTHISTFKNRFFNWFNVFRIIKYLNISSNSHFEMTDVIEASQILLNKKYQIILKNPNPKKILQVYRQIERYV